MDSHGSSGLPFDAAAYLKTPSVIVRLVSLLFAIIVFGCIADGVDSSSGCWYYGDQNACNYGIAIGVIAFIVCIAFLVLDGLVMSRDDDLLKKKVIYADLVFSALWTLMWFIGFCYLTDRWRKSNHPLVQPSSHVKNNAQAAIAFSFFSIASWAFLAVFAFKRVREYNAGASGYNAQVDDTSGGGGGGGDPGYSSFPAQPDLSESYQKPPFSGEGEKSDYQPPAY